MKPTQPDSQGHHGPSGGMFVQETLLEPLNELTRICKKARKDRKRGQVMLEYVVALGVFVALVGICALLIHVFRAYGNRVLDIISVS